MAGSWLGGASIRPLQPIAVRRLRSLRRANQACVLVTAKASERAPKPRPDEAVYFFIAIAKVAKDRDAFPKNRVVSFSNLSPNQLILKLQALSFRRLAKVAILPAAMSIIEVLTDLLQWVQRGDKLPKAWRLDSNAIKNQSRTRRNSVRDEGPIPEIPQGKKRITQRKPDFIGEDSPESPAWPELIKGVECQVCILKVGEELSDLGYGSAALSGDDQLSRFLWHLPSLRLPRACALGRLMACAPSALQLNFKPLVIYRSV